MSAHVLVNATFGGGTSPIWGVGSGIRAVQGSPGARPSVVGRRAVASV
jgi:hypothetical protein